MARAKWFDRLGDCQGHGCRKPATGILRDIFNAEIAKFCEPCAQKRIQMEHRALPTPRAAPIVNPAAARKPE